MPVEDKPEADIEKQTSEASKRPVAGGISTHGVPADQDAVKTVVQPGQSTNSGGFFSRPVLVFLSGFAVSLPYIVDAMRMTAFNVPHTVTYGGVNGVLSVLSNIPTYIVIGGALLFATSALLCFVLFFVSVIIGSIPFIFGVLKLAGRGGDRKSVV